jgi:hypothetical protein
MSIATGNVTTSVGNVYVSSGSTAITWLSLTNYSAANVTANVFVVPSGDIAGNLNVVLTNIEIAVNDTYQIYNAGEKLLLDTGDSIQADASADNAINTVTSYTAI